MYIMWVMYCYGCDLRLLIDCECLEYISGVTNDMRKERLWRD